MNTEEKTAVIAQISYKEYLIAQIASGVAANNILTTHTDAQLAEITINFADKIIERINSLPT